jgi:hypothetical protein
VVARDGQMKSTGEINQADVGVSRLKDHEVAALVNRLTEVAKTFHSTQQLRERIAHEIRPIFVKGSEKSKPVEFDGIKNSTYEPSEDLIRKVFMECGFTIKDGQSDLKPYVFLAARKLVEAAFNEVKEAGNMQLSEKEIRDEWHKAGGSIHGPRVEKVTMPEQQYFAFRRSIAAPTLHQLASNQLSGNSGELTQAVKNDNDAAFETWWESHGQFCRAGGGDYEKTFAYAAWNAVQERKSAQ